MDRKVVSHFTTRSKYNSEKKAKYKKKNAKITKYKKTDYKKDKMQKGKIQIRHITKGQNTNMTNHNKNEITFLRGDSCIMHHHMDYEKLIFG